MKISVIVPVYNVEKYIRKCLDSLVNQTFKDFEIIIVNDGTKDNSKQIVDEYISKYPNLIKYLEKENGGQASARNLGLKHAIGDYVTFVDPDDWIELEMLEKLYNRMTETNSDIVVCGAYSVIDGENNKIETFNQHTKDNHKNYILNCSGPCWQLIKTSIFIENNLNFLEQRFYEDISIIPSLCLFAKKVEFLDESLYYYLIRSGSTMNQIEYNPSLEDIFSSLSNLSEIFQKNNVYQKFYQELEYVYIEHLLHAASLRFFKFKKYEQLNKIIEIMHDKFPKWNKNSYYKKQNIKYKIVCSLFYKKKYNLLKIILKG